jgi:hypothetical protein
MLRRDHEGLYAGPYGIEIFGEIKLASGLQAPERSVTRRNGVTGVTFAPCSSGVLPT